MPSAFATHRAMAASAVDRVMGEPVLISPRVMLAKRPRGPDPDRVEAQIIARLRIKPRDIELEGQRRGTDLGGFSMLQGAEATLSISPVEHPKLGYVIAEGDLVTLLAPAPGVWPRWSALASRPHAGGSLIIPLTREP